jgi:hypothetical protein
MDEANQAVDGEIPSGESFFMAVAPYDRVADSA